MEEVFDNGGDALGALGRHIDKVGRTHKLILVDVNTLVEVKLHLEIDSGMFKVIVMESRKVFKELLQCLV